MVGNSGTFTNSLLNEFQAMNFVAAAVGRGQALAAVDHCG
jgi:hypothetical protein